VSRDEDFAAFLDLRQRAAAAFLDGDASAVAALVSSEPGATFFEPGGAVLLGAEKIRERFRRTAQGFSQGSYSFQVLHHEVGEALACVVGIQRSTTHVKGRGEPLRLNLRVTEIFRREDGSWKLVHRHADALAPER
jgi:ketosteroid isomerase-like protein